MLDDVLEFCETAIVHVGASDSDITEAGRDEV